MPETLVPLFGTGFSSKSVDVTAQELLNLYREPQKDQDKTALAYYGTPGLILLTSVSSNPSRGARVFGNFIYSVHGPTLFQINNAGICVALGTLNTTSGRVSLSDNGLQLIIVDGLNGYTLTFASNAFAQIVSAGFPNGAATVTYLDSFFICDNNNAAVGRFNWSALNDGTTWSSLDFANAESNPDPLQCVFANAGDLFLFGTVTYEIWSPTGDTRVFARVGGAGAEWGLPARFCVDKFDDSSLIMLGKNKLGQVQPIIINGYTASQIGGGQQGTGDPEVVNNINQQPSGSATCYSYSLDAHSFLQINFPNKSYLYDSLSDSWSVVQSGNLPARHLGEIRVELFGSPLVFDYSNGNLYRVDGNTYTDNGTPIVREIIGRHTLANYQRFSVNELYVDFQMGQGLAFSAQIGGAILFNGTSQYMTIPDAPQLSPGPFQTVEFWWNPTKLVDNECLCAKWTLQTQGSWALQTIGTELQFTVAVTLTDPGSTFVRTIGAGLVAGVPTHIAIVYQGPISITTQRVQIFVNGVIQALAVVGTPPLSLLTSTAPINVGFFGGTGSFYDPGWFTEFRVWNTIRTTVQINALMRVPAVGSEAGLVALYHIREGFGTTTADSTINANTASFVGAPTWVANPGVIYLAGPGSNPQCMMSWSKDGGNTYGSEVWQSLGPIGQYLVRAVWRMLGLSRDWIFRFRITDPIKVVIVNAAMLVK